LGVRYAVEVEVLANGGLLNSDASSTAGKPGDEVGRKSGRRGLAFMPISFPGGGKDQAPAKLSPLIILED
jgi:hypothetical protein